MRDGNYLGLPFLKSQRLRRFAKVFSVWVPGGAQPGQAPPLKKDPGKWFLIYRGLHLSWKNIIYSVRYDSLSWSRLDVLVGGFVVSSCFTTSRVFSSVTPELSRTLLAKPS